MDHRQETQERKALGDRRHRDVHAHELRGFKKLATGDLFVRLWTFYYDFIRPHSSLGRTPAEEAGLVRYYKDDDWFGRWERWVERASLSFYLAYISTVFGNSVRILAKVLIKKEGIIIKSMRS